MCLKQLLLFLAIQKLTQKRYLQIKIDSVMEADGAHLAFILLYFIEELSTLMRPHSWRGHHSIGGVAAGDHADQKA